ncbi:MAG TPA: ABC transporter permease [Terrisporobacter glycolicus]|uniref:ABC transporter permease n=1 Tax=Terrisporobacter TaxID=1505652 RepID=UPI000E9409F5|nr:MULTISPECIES: FtsX-like permease family protein [Terrisporobacter]MBN9648144.1 FtsX-like permease family protein [Terrisporobacter glycolicus]HBI94272.1 ABC transporter permease [Terrisporobacter hibernicus]
MNEIKRYEHIVNKQFKVNKKRNLSTISGIILSIILFTIVSYIQTYYKDVNILDAKNRSGNYEAVLRDLSSEDIHNLKNNILVDKVGLYTEMYNSTIDIGDKEKNIKVYSVDNVILNEMFYPSIKVTKGRLPQDNKEIIIDNVGKYSLHKTVGDTLKLGKENYKIVGTYDKTNSKEPYTIEILTCFNEKKNLKNVNAVFNVASKNHKVKTIRKVVYDLGIDVESKLLLNNLLLYYYGEGSPQDDSIFNDQKGVEIILYLSIFILTVLMTYGSINISMKERIEQFFILRCIGAAPIKIRVLIIRESLFLAALSIIPGIVLGQLICFFISSVIFKKIFITTIPYKIYPNVVGIVAFLSILSIVVSTIIPVIKIGRISPIEGIQNGGEINSTVKKRSAKIFNKILGYNGVLAYKNIRGNNRNFLITTITSITILTIFITFSGYSNTLLKEYNKEKNNAKDVSLEINLKYKDTYDDVFNELEKYKKEINDLGVTKDIFPQVEYCLSVIFENVQFNKYIKEKDYKNDIINKNVNINGKLCAYSDRIILLVMEDNLLKKVLTESQRKDLSLDDFKENGILISDTMLSKNFINVERVPLFNLNKNEKFTAKIQGKTYEENYKNIYTKSKELINNGSNIKFKYLGSINIEEMLEDYGFSGMTTLITSKDFYTNNKDLFVRNSREMPIESERIIFTMDLNENINREDGLRVIENYTNNIEGNYIDNKSKNLVVENNILVSSSMIYLVLFLTIIVGGLNLINNKYINIKLRSKEIGTLLAIGINKKNLKKIFMLEGIMQWFISTVISLFLSYTILIILHNILIYNGQITMMKMPILATIIGCVILLIINVLGSYLPIRKLEYTNTTELIRNKE